MHARGMQGQDLQVVGGVLGKARYRKGNVTRDTPRARKCANPMCHAGKMWVNLGFTVQNVGKLPFSDISGVRKPR
jgi:hypothetical protein